MYNNKGTLAIYLYAILVHTAFFMNLELLMNHTLYPDMFSETTVSSPTPCFSLSFLEAFPSARKLFKGSSEMNVTAIRCSYWVHWWWAYCSFVPSQGKWMIWPLTVRCHSLAQPVLELWNSHLLLQQWQVLVVFLALWCLLFLCHLEKHIAGWSF